MPFGLAAGHDTLCTKVQNIWIIVQGLTKGAIQRFGFIGPSIIDAVTILRGVPADAWTYKLGNRSALEWVVDQWKEHKISDPTVAEKFDTYRFAPQRSVSSPSWPTSAPSFGHNEHRAGDACAIRIGTQLRPLYPVCLVVYLGNLCCRQSSGIKPAILK